MRWLLAILEALAALSAAGAEPPRYTVTNRTTAQPAFVVTNRVGTAPAKQTDAERYAWLVKGAEEGRAQVMIVGPHEPLHEYIHKERFPSGFMGFADGVYDCFGQNGKAMMQKREEPADAHPFRPFQSGPSPITAGTIAPSVVVPSSSYPAITGTARTTINAITTVPLGVINGCPPSG